MMGDTSAPSSATTTHRVRKLLATYMDTAGHTLTGPANLEDARASYKLPPDVELSMGGTSASSMATPGHYRNTGDNDEDGRRNGLVTLSRIQQDSDPRRRGERHLSGEMIRRILEQQKAADRMAELHQGKTTSGGFKAPPVLLARDRSCGGPQGTTPLHHTVLWAERIASFRVGGEHRCCLPQILNSVLESVSLPAINQVCDELQIYCSTCTPEQLETLKNHKVIPVTAAQCGLITKSDAERVCSVLLDRNPPRASSSSFHVKASPFSFKVQHECFGKSYGIVLPEAYTSADAKCIECLECEGLFSPQKFVCHAHHNLEKRTCHWGFDSSHWKAYLHLSDQYTEDEKAKHEPVFQDFKTRYSSSVISLNKRKEVTGESLKDVHEGASHPKKTRLEPSQTTPSNPYNIYNLYNSWAAVVAKGYSPNAAWTNSIMTALKEGKIHPYFAAPSHGFNPLAAAARATSTYQQQLLRSKLSNEEESIVKSSQSTRSNNLSENSKPALAADHGENTSHQGSTSSLAEDISSIRDALDGASVVAKERTLKILERLTTRLAQTESERDTALENLQDLQQRYRATEEELHKKRAELRELLQQDHERPAVTLELLHSNDRSVAAATGVVSATSSYLPKVDMKSPARIIEEKERSSTSSRSSRSNSSTTTIAAKHPSSPCRVSSPLSIKSKDSEEVRDRLISMEAELRALREELSQRPPVEEVEPSKKSHKKEIKCEQQTV